MDWRLVTSSRTVSGRVQVIQQEFSLLQKVFWSLKIVTMGSDALSPAPNKAIHCTLKFCWLDGVDDGVDLAAQLIHQGKPATLEMLLDASKQEVITWCHVRGISLVGKHINVIVLNEIPDKACMMCGCTIMLQDPLVVGKLLRASVVDGMAQALQNSMVDVPSNAQTPGYELAMDHAFFVEKCDQHDALLSQI